MFTLKKTSIFILFCIVFNFCSYFRDIYAQSGSFSEREARGALAGKNLNSADGDYLMNAGGLSFSKDNKKTSLSARDLSISRSNANRVNRVHLNYIRIEGEEGSSGADLKLKGDISTPDTRFTFGGNVKKIEDVSAWTHGYAGGGKIKTKSDGGISYLYVGLNNQISFEAADSRGGGREITGRFYVDPKANKFLFETTFKDGDKINIRVYPFTFKSEKVGNDAKMLLSAKLEKQNLENYLRTVTGLLDFQNINDFISAGNDKIKIKLKGGGAGGVELIYSNPRLGMNKSDFADREELAFGLGIFNRDSEGAERSTGVIFSSDSSLSYDIQHGKLSIAGVPLPDRARIPLTIGAYWSGVDNEGNAIFATLGTSLADLGSLNGALAVKNKIGENSFLHYGVAANSNGNIAASMGYETLLSVPNSSLYDKNRIWGKDLTSKERDQIIFSPFKRSLER